MYKDYVKQEIGVDIYALFTLVLFTAFFVGLLIYAFTMRKKLVEEMRNFPLDLDDDNTIKKLENNTTNQTSSIL